MKNWHIILLLLGAFLVYYYIQSRKVLGLAPIPTNFAGIDDTTILPGQPGGSAGQGIGYTRKMTGSSAWG